MEQLLFFDIGMGFKDTLTFRNWQVMDTRGYHRIWITYTVCYLHNLLLTQNWHLQHWNYKKGTITFIQ